MLSRLLLPSRKLLSCHVRGFVASRFVSTGGALQKIAKKAKADDKIILAKKQNINQSPLKVKFLCSLIRGAWMPDAIAQMKFSPKPRAGDVMKILKRACALAKLNYNAIPEELAVKEVVVNKGNLMKRLRIMGRGRQGISRKRTAHVSIKVAQIDFTRKIAEAPTISQKKKWQKIADLVNKLKAEQQTVTEVVSSSA